MKINSILIFALFFMSCNTQKTTTDPFQDKEETTMSMENTNTSGSSLVQPKEPLLGKWQLEYISPTSGKDIGHFKIQKPYLNFVDDHKVAGNNGCNNIAGLYEFDEENIRFMTDKFKSTRMFCENLDETAFINGLASVNRWAVMEDGLKLVLIADDVIMMSFTKVIEKQISPVK